MTVKYKKIKILLVDHFGGMSGGQRSAIQLLSKADKDEFEFIVACPGGDSEFSNALSRLGIVVEEIPFNAPRFDPAREGTIYRHPIRLVASLPRIFKSINKLRSIIKARNIDVVYGNSFKASALLSCMIGPARKPLVVRLRSSRAFSNHGWIDRLICRRADLLLANSKYVADTFSPITKNNSKLKVLYNCGGIAFEHDENKEPDKSRLRAELGLNESTIVFGQVGRLTPRKRILDVIRCLPYLEKNISEYKCLFVGGADESGESGRLFKSAVNLANQLGVSHRVKFLGERDDALRIINGLDVMVLASQDEPMARVVIEALGLGTPIIASKHGGNAEIINHCINGMTYPLGDSKALGEMLIKLINNRLLQETIQKNGKRTYKDNFTESATLYEEYKLIRELLL